MDVSKPNFPFPSSLLVWNKLWWTIQYQNLWLIMLGLIIFLFFCSFTHTKLWQRKKWSIELNKFSGLQSCCNKFLCFINNIAQVFMCAKMIEQLCEISDARNIKFIKMDNVTIPADQHNKYTKKWKINYKQHSSFSKFILSLNLEYFAIKSGNVDEQSLFNAKFMDDFVSGTRIISDFYVKTSSTFTVGFEETYFFKNKILIHKSQ